MKANNLRIFVFAKKGRGFNNSKRMFPFLKASLEDVVSCKTTQRTATSLESYECLYLESKYFIVFDEQKLIIYLSNPEMPVLRVSAYVQPTTDKLAPIFFVLMASRGT